MTATTKTPEEKTVLVGIGAKKVVKTKQKAPVKKAAAKKSAKAVKAIAKEVARRVFDDSARITLLVKENPRREGTAVWKQFVILQKSKTFGDYAKAGGRTDCLQKCIKKGWAKVSA